MNKSETPAAPLTLMDLLNSRENRVNHQKELLEKYADSVLISMTLNIPGPVKDSAQYRKALETGTHRLKAMLNSEAILYEELRPLVTGSEAYIVVQADPLTIKKAAIAAEEADALGRLFDIDVLVIDDDALQDKMPEGTSNNTAVGGTFHLSLTDIRTISRSQLGAKPRKCLLCGENAKVCARSRAHSMDDLLKKISEILSDAGL